MKILYFSGMNDLVIDNEAKTVTSFHAYDFNYMKVATDSKVQAIVKVDLGDLNQLELVAVNEGYALTVLEPKPEPDEPETDEADPAV